MDGTIGAGTETHLNGGLGIRGKSFSLSSAAWSSRRREEEEEEEEEGGGGGEEEGGGGRRRRGGGGRRRREEEERRRREEEEEGEGGAGKCTITIHCWSTLTCEVAPKHCGGGAMPLCQVIGAVALQCIVRHCCAVLSAKLPQQGF